MDDAAINAAIAKRLGWKEDWSDGTFWGWAHPPTSRIFVDSPPNFATSLDAMAQAEATMTLLERTNYINEILPDIDTYIQYVDEWLLLTVPARTRALAFLAATKNRSVSNE